MLSTVKLKPECSGDVKLRSAMRWPGLIALKILGSLMGSFPDICKDNRKPERNFFLDHVFFV